MSHLKTRRSLVLLLGAMLVAVPVSSFAVSLGNDNGSPGAPDRSDAGSGPDSGGTTGPSIAGSDGSPGDDTGSPPSDPCSTYDPCSPDEP